MAELRNWWVREMIATPNPMAERLILLWHNHFVTAYSGLQEEVHAVALQHWTFRELGHGSFRDLTHAIVRDPAMLNYLDNNRSPQGTAEREPGARADGIVCPGRRKLHRSDGQGSGPRPYRL